jgi:alanine racemase
VASKPTRRRFLATSSVLAGAGLSSLPLAPATPPQSPASASSFDPWIEIHPSNLAHNVREISRRVAGRPILAVIKNNAYGMGLEHAAGLLEPMAPIHGFAVVKMQEAIALRDAGVRKPVLLMGPFERRDLEELAARGIMPMVYTPLGPDLDRVAAARQQPIAVHICVDTGIGRVGVPHRQAAPLIRDLAGRTSVAIHGVMMTFSEDAELDQEQIRRFDALCGELRQSGVQLGRRHTASSYTLFQHPGAFYDMVRPGMAIYGVYSEGDFRKSGALDLRPAMALRARVAYVKRVARGDSVGYSRAYIAKDDVWVATLPVGHTDGWPRAAAKGARVRIGDRTYPVIASVSASHTIVEIGAERRVGIGDVATCWDWQKDSRPEDVSAACGASVYDLTMHLNPLLPRRAV